MNSDALRTAEVAGKLALVRALLAHENVAALRLRGSDWFAWITGGGSSTVLFTSEVGVAEVLVTHETACVLTDQIEAERLRAEQLGEGFDFHVTPWAEPLLRERFVHGIVNGGVVLSDRPLPLADPQERPLPMALRLNRMTLGEHELQRYRVLGQQAAAAMTEVLKRARPDWSELELAAVASAALWRRGIEPALVLVAGERRLPLYRHPLPTSERLGRRAMLVFCARRHGLYANLTRCVGFDGAGPSLDEQQRLLEVEATALAATTPGQSLAAVYHALVQAYRHADAEQAIGEHHQGGLTGYASREIIATASSATRIEAGMVCALNPSLTGMKVEDTFLITHSSHENLTFDPHWPATEVRGRARPLWLEA